MSGDHLLRDRCSWQQFTGETTDQTTGGKTPAYATAVSLKCMVGQPSRRWQTAWPETRLTGSKEFWLPCRSSVAVRDLLTHEGVTYEVVDTALWRKDGKPDSFSVLCEVRDERVT